MRPNCTMSRYNERFMIVARRVLIGGRVQGVGFRMFAAARAAAEGIQGHARNLPDGRVEVLMEGDDEAVDRMELALRRGPSHANQGAALAKGASLLFLNSDTRVL